jgi:glycosyltransferase involved in cell wall biosynthesis
VKYLCYNSVTLSKILESIKEIEPKLIYLNSFWDTTLSLKIIFANRLGLIKKPILLAPRGEFSRGALGIKPIRKRLFLQISRILRLHRNITWQASSEQEKNDIIGALTFSPNLDVRVAMDLSPQTRPIPNQNYVKPPILRVCFLSRITAMKNLDFALKVLAQVKSQVTFSIYGPKESPTYWDLCANLIERLPPNITAIYYGEVLPKDVGECLATQDLFFLPTKGENYGHVIHEALSVGLPVLISDQTPWGVVSSEGAGWTVPLKAPNTYSEIIDEVASCDSRKMLQMRKNAQEVANLQEVRLQTVKANLSLLRSLSQA